MVERGQDSLAVEILTDGQLLLQCDSGDEAGGEALGSR
jgi:hypothetical protein